MNRALFLDRDGIIIKDVSYPHKIKDLIINNEIIPYLKHFLELGFKLIIVTNQAGISKGKFTMDQYKEFQEELIHRLSLLGVNITDTYFCPYHKDGVVEPFNVDSYDRKPKPGMFLKAAKDHNIDISRSFMIGDKFSDIIELESLKCYILESEYNRGEPGTYTTVDDIFWEINSEL